MEVDREIGTLWYRAAEVLMGATTYTPKVDEWGVGCIVLEMFVGRPVFHGDPRHACGCAATSHRNFNADQIHQIFQVVGSPSKRALVGMTCAPHFRDWDQYESVIPDLVQEVCVGEDVETVEGWTALLTGLLELNPARRLSARSALDSDVFTTPPPQDLAKPAACKPAKPSPDLDLAGARDLAEDSGESPDPTVLDGAFALNDQRAPARHPATRNTLLQRTCSSEYERRARSPLHGRAKPAEPWGTGLARAAGGHKAAHARPLPQIPAHAHDAWGEGGASPARVPGAREAVLEGEARSAGGERFTSPSSFHTSPRPSPRRGRRVESSSRAGRLSSRSESEEAPCGASGKSPRGALRGDTPGVSPVRAELPHDVVA